MALAIVNVELAGWNMPVRRSTSPSGFSGGDEVLDLDVHQVADLDRVAATVIDVVDRGRLHAKHLADQRAQHRPSARLPGPRTPRRASSACSGEAAASITRPPASCPQLISGGVSATTTTVLSLTSTPSTSPWSTWKASTTRQRSWSAGMVSPEVVQGHTMSQEQFSK